MTRKLCPQGHGSFSDSADLCISCGAPLIVDQGARVIAQRFRLDRIIGLGGTRSTVWEGLDLRTTRQVAVKLLPEPTGVELTRFMRGAYIFAELDHPNIARVYEYGEYGDAGQGGGLYLVMERLEGATLDRVLRKGPLTYARALSLAEQLLDALGAIHDLRAVHRDIKPGNLFVTPDEIDGRWRVRLFDFDLATRYEDLTTTELYGDVLRAPESASICGTPEYMAPEQILGQPVDGRADLYAAGMTLYRMLAGRPAFGGPERRDVYRAQLRDPLPPLPAIPGRPPLPHGLDAVLAQATAKRPVDRFVRARDFRMALRGLGARVLARA